MSPVNTGVPLLEARRGAVEPQGVAQLMCQSVREMIPSMKITSQAFGGCWRPRRSTPGQELELPRHSRR